MQQPHCGCHDEIGEAIAGHFTVVYRQARSLGINRESSVWADAVSDGQLALWKALCNFDPDRGMLSQHLSLNVRRGILNGLNRNISTRDALAPRHHPVYLDLIDLDQYSEPAAEAVMPSRYTELAAVDPRLPQIARDLAAGLTPAETGRRCGLSDRQGRRLLVAARRAA